MITHNSTPVRSEPTRQPTGRIALGVAVPILGMMGLLAIGIWNRPERFGSWHANPMMDAQFTYQGLTFLLALAFWGVLAILFPAALRKYARVGEVAAPAQPVRWLGIKPGESWRSVGTSFAVIMLVVTFVYVFFGLLGGSLPPAASLAVLPWVLLFAVVNAFVEETLSRLGVVVGLDGLLKPATIALISALVFGLPHFLGSPGGPLGSLLAGFMGWMMAKSMIETRGFFWAWFIHFLLDIPILFGLIVAAM